MRFLSRQIVRNLLKKQQQLLEEEQARAQAQAQVQEQERKQEQQEQRQRQQQQQRQRRRQQQIEEKRQRRKLFNGAGLYNLARCDISSCSTYNSFQMILQRLLHSAKRTHPSADRNSQPIADALKDILDAEKPDLKLLEIASGSGQHVGFIAPLFPNITFQPTEYDHLHFSSISAYAADCPTKNIAEPFTVDIAKDPDEWKEAKFNKESFDYVLNCNMMHITEWACSEGLFLAAGKLLKPNGGLLITYGPYAVDGQLTPESNVKFDQSLKSRNPAWGVRDVSDLKMLAKKNGLELKDTIEMPANNKILVWTKGSAKESSASS